MRRTPKQNLVLKEKDLPALCGPDDAGSEVVTPYRRAWPCCIGARVWQEKSEYYISSTATRRALAEPYYGQLVLHGPSVRDGEAVP